MDTFLDLPFWLSVALGVLYGVIWLVFFVVLFATHRRAHNNRRHSTMGLDGQQGEDESVSVVRSRSLGGATNYYSETSVYDEDDD